MLCRKYKSTLKFCYEKKKKMGFVKIKKIIIFLAEQDLQGHCPHNVPVDYLHSPCPLYPYGGVQFLCQRPCHADPAGGPPADRQRWCGGRRGLRQTLCYDTQPRCTYVYKYMYISAALYTAHCTNASGFPRGLS